jgi:hypothetical protein
MPLVSRRNIRSLGICAGLSVMLGVVPALAAVEQEFEVKKTSQLVDLCGAKQADPLYVEAANFCHGYLVGVFSYYLAARKKGSKIRFCHLPPTRQEGVDRFVQWAKAHPEVANELPVNAFFRFMDATYACK